MRILMAHWMLRWSGAQVVMTQLSDYLRAKGHRVDFVTTVAPGEAAPQFRTHCDELWHFPDTGSEPPILYLKRFKSTIERKGYDLFVTHHSLQGVAVAGLLPRTVATLSVIHEHPVTGSGYIGLSNPGAFDGFVGVSQGVTCGVREILGDLPSIRCILNGVKAGRSLDRPERPELHVLYVGRLVEEQKGILLLPGIVRESRKRGVPMRLTIVGDGEDRARLVEEIRRQRVSEWIALLGARPQGEVFEYMEQADILLLCSRHEGLPLVLAEAMYRGSVPVAARIGESTVEIVTDGVDGILVGGRDPSAFAESLSNLWTDRSRLASMRRQARETAASRFSEDRMCREYEALFEELLALPADRTRVQNCPRFMAS